LLKKNHLPFLYFTVTTDLNYDQRMIRICSSLANAGYNVTLVGISKSDSVALQPRNYYQKRIRMMSRKGFFFYAEYNIRLFFLLLFKRMDGICAIDLDSILPCLLVSKIKGIKRIYDAHELFCEMKEIISRPRIYRFWKRIEKITIPRFKNAYTVNRPIAEEFEKMYSHPFTVIRNLAAYNPTLQLAKKEKFILYQGALNEGRCFETLIPAMQWIEVPLVICGEGNFSDQARLLAAKYRVGDKIIFKGKLLPADLSIQTSKAYIGITLFEKESQSNYWSLANRFFDYLQSGTPQLVVDYPVYREINNSCNIGVLINDLTAVSIARHLNDLLQDEEKWLQLHHNCLQLSKTLNWQEEEKTLLAFYKNIFG